MILLMASVVETLIEARPLPDNGVEFGDVHGSGIGSVLIFLFRQS